MFTVMTSTFEYLKFDVISNSLIFFLSNMINLGEHSFLITYNQSQFYWNVNVIQNFNEIFEVGHFKTTRCDHHYTSDNACTLLDFSSKLIIQNQFSNYSKAIMFSDLSIVLEVASSVLHVVNESTLQIIGPPRQSMTITISYLSHSATSNLVSNDCHFPKLNSGHGCLCSKGMEFNSLGECVECSLNYYSSSEFNSECRSCSFPRVTLQKGSSDLVQCVCPLNTLDSVDSCLPCPHLAECGYGNLTGIEPGFRLNTDTWELDECVFWYSCHENSCRSRHAYGDLCQYCTEDAVVTRIYCIGKEHLFFKILLFMFFVVVLFVADVLLIAFLQSKVMSRAFMIVHLFFIVFPFLSNFEASFKLFQYFECLSFLSFSLQLQKSFLQFDFS
ncbi:hypothetical protein GEMRC1_008593 [Eukaryota sp. GEM-RC1]